jgi:RecA/RadA recombinase
MAKKKTNLNIEEESVKEVISSGKVKKVDFSDLKNELKKITVLGGSLRDNDFGSVKSYIDSGNYSLNALLSGTLFGGYPSGRLIEIAGEKSTGKTYCLLNAVREAQKCGGQVLYYDSEAALNKIDAENNFEINLDDVWLEPANIIEDIKIHLYQTVNYLVTKKRAGFEIPKLFIVIDSLGNLASKKEVEDAKDGKTTADLTRAKALASLFRIIAIPLAEIDATLVYSNHVYDVTTMFGGTKGKGGKGREYIASIIVDFSKYKAAEQNAHNGIIIKARIKEKNRFAVPVDIQFYIDFKKGMNRYFGLPFKGLPFKTEWFIDIEKEGWDVCGIQYGKIITKNQLEELRDKYKKVDFSEIEETEYNDTYYFVNKKLCTKLGLESNKLAIKHLITEVGVGEFYTDKVFTEEVLKLLDEKIIKPKFSYKSKDDIEYVIENIDSAEISEESIVEELEFDQEL